MDEAIIHITIDGEELETNPEPPFYPSASLRAGVEGEGWTDIEDLQVGDEVCRSVI